MKELIKLITIYILRIFMRLLYVFPIKKNRVIFNSYTGTQYACNPKYISEYLRLHYGQKFEIYWAFREPEKFRFLESTGISVIPYSSLKRFYIEATAGFSINNIGSFSWLPVRKGQEHINTNHGVPYKRIALGEKNNHYFMRKSLLLTAKETTKAISCNSYFTNTALPVDFGYKGEVLNFGYPRNDILFNHDLEVRKRVREYYKLADTDFVVLYAPTWRYDTNKPIASLDFNQIGRCIEDTFSRKPVFLFRAHHLMENMVKDNKDIIDASGYSDSQELMLGCNMLITDYSSMIWDFSLMYRPIFLYTPDLEEYKKERGLAIDIASMGIDYAVTNEELAMAIKQYDEKEYRAKLKAHHNSLGSYERGTAAQQVCEWMDSML